MGLSSNIFWHQTSEEGLNGILSDKCLYYSYSHEYIKISGKNAVNIAVPSICFSGLPLGELSSFLCAISKNKALGNNCMGRYGDYTIGFTRTWGVRNRISPVWYCETDSDVLTNLYKQKAYITQLIKTNPKSESDDSMKLLLCWIRTISYVKNFEGSLKHKKYKRYRFYDEREFRYVPSYDRMLAKQYMPLFINSKEDMEEIKRLRKDKGEQIADHYILEYEKYKKEHDGSSLIKDKELSVDFDWEDIGYIIVKDRTKKVELTKKINNLGKETSHIVILTIKDVLNNIIGSHHNINDTTA